MNHLGALSHLRSQRLPSRRVGLWTVTINTDHLRALFFARHFLAGILIGTVIVLAVFLVMD